MENTFQTMDKDNFKEIIDIGLNDIWYKSNINLQ